MTGPAAEFITVVSGIPRSGTSLMMRMLEAGGVPALTDHRRSPDAHNPHGYFEYEPVKRLADGAPWMEEARGKAVKVIYRLLRHLPPGFEYRVLLMQRSLAEVFESQREMLRAKSDAAAHQDKELLVPALAKELREVQEWLAAQPMIRALEVPYAELLRNAAAWCPRISQFLGRVLDEAAMIAAVDPALYRHREPGR